MTGGTYSVCPSCAAVVADPPKHAGVCTALAVLATGATVEVDQGPAWPTGVPVTVTATLAPSERGRRETIRTAVTDALTDIAQGIGAMESYLANQSPTQAQVVAQVRALTIAQREVLILTRRLIRVLIRTYLED